jgi:hypothetical protein
MRDTLARSVRVGGGGGGGRAGSGGGRKPRVGGVARKAPMCQDCGLKSANYGPDRRKVRKPPGWPRSWANFSLLQLHSHRHAWASLHRLGQPNTFLAQGVLRRLRKEARRARADDLAEERDLRPHLITAARHLAAGIYSR